MKPKHIIIFAVCAALVIAAAFYSTRESGKNGKIVTIPATPQHAAGKSSAAGSGGTMASSDIAHSLVPKTVDAGSAVHPTTAQVAAATPPGAVPVNVQAIRTMNLRTNGPVGELTVARVTNAGQELTLTPNEIGHFPKIYIEPKAKVPVTLTFPEGAPDDPVAVRVEDGGSLDSQGAPGKLYKLDDSRTINFAFNANSDPGIYRVVVSKGSETRVLNFWAGPDLPIRQ